jgi:hypothetical protein
VLLYKRAVITPKSVVISTIVSLEFVDAVSFVTLVVDFVVGFVVVGFAFWANKPMLQKMAAVKNSFFIY